MCRFPCSSSELKWISLLAGLRCGADRRSIAEAQRRRVQTVALILYNGSTHAPKQLPLWVKELATRSDGKLTMQLYWLPTDASWLDQIEIWFSTGGLIGGTLLWRQD